MGSLTIIAHTGRMLSGTCSKRPDSERLAEWVSGEPETVYVLHNGQRAHMIVNEQGHALGLPANAVATQIYWANTRAKGGKVTDYFIAGDAVLLEGAACAESESAC